MESHSSHRAPHQETVPKESKKLTTHQEARELSPALQTLLAIAKAKYSPYVKVTEQFDDSQEVFSSTMANLLHGFNLTAKSAAYTVDAAKK